MAKLFLILVLSLIFFTANGQVKSNTPDVRYYCNKAKILKVVNGELKNQGVFNQKTIIIYSENEKLFEVITDKVAKYKILNSKLLKDDKEAIVRIYEVYDLNNKVKIAIWLFKYKEINQYSVVVWGENKTAAVEFVADKIE